MSDRMPAKILHQRRDKMPERMLNKMPVSIAFHINCWYIRQRECQREWLLSNCAQKVFGAKQFQKPFIQTHFIHISLGKAVPFTLGSQIHAES